LLYESLILYLKIFVKNFEVLLNHVTHLNLLVKIWIAFNETLIQLALTIIVFIFRRCINLSNIIVRCDIACKFTKTQRCLCYKSNIFFNITIKTKINKTLKFLKLSWCYILKDWIVPMRFLSYTKMHWRTPKDSMPRAQPGATDGCWPSLERRRTVWNEGKEKDCQYRVREWS